MYILYSFNYLRDFFLYNKIISLENLHPGGHTSAAKFEWSIKSFIIRLIEYIMSVIASIGDLKL